ncbi:MAG: hypothetical protein JSW40_08210 [Candidatus Omnitrophota bacterium]|nr:MAG: hypothetical protein JSW40_08210 [Candidatus Omnitrophota bacterium]
MQKLRRTLVLVVVCIFILGYSNSYARDWKTYKSPTGYAIRHPSHWTVTSSTGDIIAAPSQSAFLYIMVTPATELEAFADSYYENEIENSASCTLIRRGRMKIADRGAISLEYTEQGAGETLKHKAYFLVDVVGYLLMFSSTKEDFDVYLSTGEKIVKSFKPIPKKEAESLWEDTEPTSAF